MRRGIESGIFGLSPRARSHHVVYDEPTGRVRAISGSHGIEDFRDANKLAAQLGNATVEFMLPGQPYRFAGPDSNIQLKHGVTDEHHLDSNARRIQERAEGLAEERKRYGIPKDRLASDPNVWME